MSENAEATTAAGGGSASDAAAPAMQKHPEAACVTEQGAVADGAPRHHPARRWIILGLVGVVAVIALFLAIPAIHAALTTVSTDDAYVNSHVTFAAPRVSGQVTRVLVDDNNRVRKGDLIVQLDKEPYEVQVRIKEAAVTLAQTYLQATTAQVRANEAQARSLRFKLEHAMEDVDNQIALLKTNVAALESSHAVSKRAQQDLDRAMPLVKSGAISSEELDRRSEALSVAQASVREAEQRVAQVRVGLGLPALSPDANPAAVPADLDETFSSVRQAQAELMEAAFPLGIEYSLDKGPKQTIEDFYKRDPEGNIDRIYAKLLKESPVVKEAEAKVSQAQRDLDQARLDLRYCDIYAAIDGVVTRRNVNPGNNVVSGQELLAIRSLSEVWVDANFKETQLADLRIGQPAELKLDMYGKKKIFKGRVSGFTEGTGSTLALLPAQNATGNFVKVVQRLPVRIDLLNYDPDTDPIFVGLSVEASVRVNEAPNGPDAGKVLQPFLSPPTAMPAAAPNGDAK